MVKLRTWGITIHTPAGSRRHVVAVKKKPEAVVAMNTVCFISAYAFNQMASQTGNTTEIQAAMSKPGTVFVATADICGHGSKNRQYVEVKKRK